MSCLGCTCYLLLGHKNSDLHLLRLNTNLPQYILGQEYEAIFVEKINSQFIERQAFYHRLVQKYITSVKMKKKQCFMQKQKLTSQHQVTWDYRKYRTSCDTCAPIYFGLLLFYGRFSRIHAVPLSGLLYLYWGNRLWFTNQGCYIGTGQSYNDPHASEVTPKHIGKIYRYQTKH